MIHLSVVIPAYNEETRIGPTLDEVYNFLSSKKYDFEVILVDDGSRDRTVDVAASSRLFEENKLTILKNGSNKGKGSSVKNGIIHSSGEFILFSDADLSTPIGEFDKLFGEINKGYDIVIGSRALKDSDVKVHQLWHREVMGKTFNFFVKLLLMRGLGDTQCGFKLFKGDAARKIAFSMKVKGFCFDVEMLYLAKIKGYNVREIGVIWENSPESKVRLFSSPLSMFLDLFAIKRIHKDRQI
ncbi:MAG: glycosyltransferase family 2 protein [Candidatus Omnitrophota bacterium]|nr:glycosyltransferase family 2 protein [Candidatus Omnitrophota bacterium]